LKPRAVSNSDVAVNRKNEEKLTYA
jgi:hypothetical protein